ncbi:MAG: MBL fold metallo-hydrolase [Candidatus Acidiferrum sp.]
MSFFSRLISLIVLCAAIGSSQATASSSSGKLPFELKMVGPNVWAAIDDQEGDAGANAGFVLGNSGVVVIDTFENEEAAKALLVEIRKITQLPIKFVVNTHYHVDHVAGNRVFQSAGAVVVAHRNVSFWVNSENLKLFGDKIKPEEKAMVEHLLGPDVVYDSELTLLLGARHIELRFLPGHTGGDTIVIIPDAGVVFCGDLFWRRTLPNLIDATTSAWIRTLSDIQTIPASPAPGITATFVPGHGNIGNASDVQDFQKYLGFLRSLTQKAINDGKTGDDLVNTVLPELTQAYGSWDWFKDFSRSDILDVAAELNGSKRVPTPNKK